MASLREVKYRIASVRSTLKITSAMKLVASSKLRKAQRTIEALRPYEEALSQILAAVSSGSASASPAADGSENGEFAPKFSKNGRNWSENGEFAPDSGVGPAGLRSSEGATQGVSGGTPPVPWGCRGMVGEVVHRTVVLAFASNSSMCGAFNANVIKKTLEVVRGCGGPVECWAFGRKMAEALRKEGIPAARDYTSLVAHPSFDAVAAVAAELRELYAAGEISGAVLVYNHFVSTGRQEVVVESYLSSGCSFASPEMTPVDFAPSELIPPTPNGAGPSRSHGHGRPWSPESFPDSASLQPENDELYILEPSRAELLESLMPQVLDMKLYAALLDSAASEHAARMIAMQTATDNAEELLGELTLEYNKGRQQKITSEILDLVSAEA